MRPSTMPRRMWWRLRRRERTAAARTVRRGGAIEIVTVLRCRDEIWIASRAIVGGAQ